MFANWELKLKQLQKHYVKYCSPYIIYEEGSTIDGDAGLSVSLVLTAAS